MIKVNISVIGFGRISKRHAKIFQEFEHTELVSVTDVSSNELSGAKDLDIDVPVYDSIDEFLIRDKQQSDLVTIATPNGYHTDYAERLLRAGYHVLIEKPMGLDIGSCMSVIEAQEATGKRVFVVKQNRYSPPSVWMNAMVKNKP